MEGQAANCKKVCRHHEREHPRGGEVGDRGQERWPCGHLEDKQELIPLGGSDGKAGRKRRWHKGGTVNSTLREMSAQRRTSVPAGWKSCHEHFPPLEIPWR